jgi:hypothetical protein
MVERQAISVPHNVCERTVSLRKIKLDVANALGRALGLMEHPSIWQSGNNAVFGVSDWVENRLSTGTHDLRYVDAGTPIFDVPLPVNIGKHRLVVVLDDHAEDLEYGAIDSHGQPKSQLQYSMYSASMDHSRTAIT